jgi:hypothetical protein
LLFSWFIFLEIQLYCWVLPDKEIKCVKNNHSRSVVSTTVPCFQRHRSVYSAAPFRVFSGTVPCLSTEPFRVFQRNRSMSFNGTVPCLSTEPFRVFQRNCSVYFNGTVPCISTELFRVFQRNCSVSFNGTVPFKYPYPYGHVC